MFRRWSFNSIFMCYCAVSKIAFASCLKTCFAWRGSSNTAGCRSRLNTTLRYWNFENLFFFFLVNWIFNDLLIILRDFKDNWFLPKHSLCFCICSFTWLILRASTYNPVYLTVVRSHCFSSNSYKFHFPDRLGFFLSNWDAKCTRVPQKSA